MNETAVKFLIKMALIPFPALFLFVFGCEVPPEKPVEEAVIVVVACEPRAGYPDCATVVRFGDNTLRDRHGVWGTAGDTIAAQKYRGSWR